MAARVESQETWDTTQLDVDISTLDFYDLLKMSRNTIVICEFVYADLRPGYEYPTQRFLTFIINALMTWSQISWSSEGSLRWSGALNSQLCP